MKTAIILAVLIVLRPPFVFGNEDVKLPNVAGAFYPGGPKELSGMLDDLLSAASVGEPAAGRVGVIIAPHAGYVYSGLTAAYAFKSVAGQKATTVIVLAPSHYFAFSGVAVWSRGAFATPLGQVEVDAVLADKILAADQRFTFNRSVFEKEHSLETQIPFIQKVFPGARIVPIILGQPDLAVAEALAKALVAAVDGRDDVLLDVSSDLSHFHPDEQARAIDRRGLSAVESMRLEDFWNGHVEGSMEVDAFHAITAAMLYARAAGFMDVKVVHYATSADVTGDKSRVVGYSAVAFRKPGAVSNPPGVGYEAGESKYPPLTELQKGRLLAIARSTVDAFVRNGKAPEITEADPRLAKEEGAFVTLHSNGVLRGCIGNIFGRGPLFATVREMAIAAASQDPRFPPVKAEELDRIDVEVSVLSIPRPVKNADEIVMGRHGVIVSRGPLSKGVFLPQVATETGWTREEFLSELCAQKAGLPRNCWKDPQVKLEVFTAEVFGEKK